jgi:hypothetical protein
MIENLASFLKFDPLLAATIILALTLVLGRLVDVVRARREQKKDKVQQGVVDFAQRFKDTEVSGTPDP